MSAPSPQERFWANVDRRGPDECWPWTKSRNQWGYGQFQVAGKQTNAPRYAWAFTNGRMPSAQEQACHRCDNPACCNPTHIFLGSSLDNMQDKVKKGRHRSPSGQDHGAAVITNDQAIEIRRRRAAGERGSVLAREFGVSHSLICDIHTGRRWASIQ